MKKKKLLTLEKEPYERLQALILELGWGKNWLALQIDKMIAGLLVIAEMAKKDAEEQRQMTEEEAKKRYEEAMRKLMA